MGAAKRRLNRILRKANKRPRTGHEPYNMLPLGAPCLVTLLASGVPKVLLRVLLLLILQENLARGFCDCDGIELFAGCMAITAAFQAIGYLFIPFEIKLSRRMDINSQVGFSVALRMMLRLRRNKGSIVWLAPVCSSWTWTNRGTSLRSPLDPEGNTEHKYIRDANLMVSRTILLVELAIALGVTFFLEQPMNSLMKFHARFQTLLARHLIYEVTFGVGAFGGETAKPLTVFSNAMWVNELYKPIKPGTVFSPAEPVTVKYKDGHGCDRVKGGPGMKKSEAYTREMGDHVAAVCARHRPLGPVEVFQGQGSLEETRRALRMQPADDLWLDAELKEVMDYLRS